MGDNLPHYVSLTPFNTNHLGCFCFRPQGCVVIFLSYFLALLIKMDVAEDAHLEALGGFLVAVNVLLGLGVLWTSWFAFRPMVSDSHDEGATSP